MAYLDVQSLIPDTASALPQTLAPTGMPEPVGFQRREWDVIALARGDGIASLSEPSRLARLVSLLVGGAVSRRLADPRLEALRRIAVMAWHHGYAVPASAIEGFLEAGFSADQLELLLASVAAGRSDRGRRGFRKVLQPAG